MNDPEIRERVARDHILYEVNALWTSALEHAQIDRDSLDPTISRAGNAFMEACLVHARLLAEFLDTAPRGSREDARAVHYAPGWSTTDTLNQTERNSINWHIMHLSAERERSGTRLDLVDMAERILQVFSRFVASIPDPTTRDWFAPCIAGIDRFARERSALESAGKYVRLYATTTATVITVTPQGPRP